MESRNLSRHKQRARRKDQPDGERARKKVAQSGHRNCQIAARFAAVVAGSLMFAAGVLLEMDMVMGLRENNALGFSGFIEQHVVVALAGVGALLVALAGCSAWQDERRRGRRLAD
ncbi:hypothetical protein E2562_036917 [Oryza meyeriana var. granulata]|uniref:Uncharacterized protein n=1 Tax=Oryza meyeriana var. granulata TaxID=110450 RepID=A0A6G1CLF4_9ORYZ|nr:hypothetical protein E2562_036917 [Oryza meyeriana var. granulata]